MNVRNSKKKSDKNSYLQTGSNELYKKIHLLLYIFGTQEDVRGGTQKKPDWLQGALPNRS